MKRREGDKAGGIDIEDLMVKCKQKVVVGGFERTETDYIRTLNARVDVVLICAELPVGYREKSFLRTWEGLCVKNNTEIWEVIWLVAVYCESDGPR